MTFLLTHTPECTYLEPCATCRAHKVLGKKVTEAEMKTVLELAQEFHNHHLSKFVPEIEDPIDDVVDLEPAAETPRIVGPNLRHLNGHRPGAAIWAKSVVAPPPPPAPEPLKGHMPALWTGRRA